MSAVRVECDRTDCVYHTTEPGDHLCHCTHPDKPHHMVEDVCPLYRMDWSKAKSKQDELRKRFGIGGKKK